MRHNVYGKHLGRDKNQRTALFRGLVRALVLEGSIVTTEAKVKAVKGLVDKLFAKAKKGDQASLNVITKAIPQKEVVKKILEIAKTIKNKNSGFAQTVRLGNRAGDGAMMMKMSIISPVIPNEVEGSSTNGKIAASSDFVESPRNDNDKKIEKKEEVVKAKIVKTEKPKAKKVSK